MGAVATRVFVLPIKGREVEIEQLKKLIVRAGCEVVCNDAKPVDFEKCIEGADVLAILIVSETQDDPTIDELIELASRQGKRVVGVWPPAAKDPTLPSAINRHGDAAITSDVESIRESICGGKPQWIEPDGTSRPTPKTPRHKG